MSLPAHLGQITHFPTRAALQQLHERLTAIEDLDPSQIAPGTLTANFDANQQRVTAVASPTASQDLITQSALRVTLAARLGDLYKALRGLATPTEHA